MILPLVLAAAFLASAALPAQAQATHDGWEYEFTLYGWLPRIDGTLNFDVPGTDDNRIRAYPGKLLDNLQFTFQGNFAARKGRWGFMIDLIYLKEGNSKNETVLVPLGPAGQLVEVGASMKLRNWIVEGVGTYTLVETEGGRLDFLFGVRYINLDADLSLNLEGIHPIPIPYQKHYFSSSGHAFNAIVGIKGEARLGGNWILPYYLDAGTGDSNFTWQAMAAVGYRWRICDLSLGFRYLSFNQGSDDKIHDLNAGGPILGLKFRW
jgi:hypothetical protein